MKVYNGEGMILGRLASAVAKDALLGEEVKVVNCNKIVVSGKKANVIKSQKVRRERGGHPLMRVKIPRLPDRFVRRTIRGMLPWKKARGKEAFDRVMCYNAVPEGLASENLITLPHAAASKLPTLKFTTVQEICKGLGGQGQ